ncbi:MAG: hypothetical protein ACI9DF_006052 [Verrucomicrobiales bacterium]|jgi:hypothetical protein
MQPHSLHHRFGRLILLCGLAWCAFASSAFAQEDVRIATFNASLNRARAGLLLEDLRDPSRSTARQIQRVAEIIQTVRPDILFINEFDHDAEGEGIRLFQENFLGIGQNGKEPIKYGYRFTAPSNTGLASGLDFDNNRRIAQTSGSNDYAGDAFGFGQFSGQYGMAVYSRFPIKPELARVFQSFLWKDMPNALLPNGSNGTPNWYSEEESAVFRLSSKSHWDLPIDVNGQLVHLLLSHPTPPVFDGGEDRNGRRNHDEIRFWADYLTPNKSSYIYDDAGLAGGLGEGERFVIMGDLNADPNDGDSVSGAAQQVVDHPRVNAAPIPAGHGGKEVADKNHRGDPAHDTADFSQENLRADYALPSKSGFTIRDAAVFWPERAAPISAAVRGASDHRLVYVDLTLTSITTPAPVTRLSIQRAEKQVSLRWAGQPGYDFLVRWSQDLRQPWQEDDGIAIEHEGQQWQAMDQSGESRRFYQVHASKKAVE